VRPGETQTANYFLGKDLRQKESRLSILPQTIANGIKFWLIISICAVGLSLIYGTTGLSNFAHGELVALGAIVAWYFNQYGPKLHILVAAVLGILAAMIAGGLSEG
jgi:branched-chain amino acid transport system permease protein